MAVVPQVWIPFIQISTFSFTLEEDQSYSLQCASKYSRTRNLLYVDVLCIFFLTAVAMILATYWKSSPHKTSQVKNQNSLSCWRSIFPIFMMWSISWKAAKASRGVSKKFQRCWRFVLLWKLDVKEENWCLSTSQWRPTSFIFLFTHPTRFYPQH